MKMIEAIIRQEKMEPVKAALEAMGVLGITLTEVSGRGRQGGIALQWRAGEYRVDMLPKVKLEVVLDDDKAEMAVEAICKAAKTGKEGDGMIFVLPIESAIRVRTNDDLGKCGVALNEKI
jgi:nitrogen regulatory protein P-II 1